MHPGTLTNHTTGEPLSTRAYRAEGWFSRLRGWMGRRPDPTLALGITHCDQVHTYLVHFPLDLIYCDRGGNVLRVVSGLPPGRIGPRVREADTVWEMEAGRLAPRVNPGDVLLWSPGARADSPAEGYEE